MVPNGQFVAFLTRCLVLFSPRFETRCNAEASGLPDLRRVDGRADFEPQRPANDDDIQIVLDLVVFINFAAGVCRGLGLDEVLREQEGHVGHDLPKKLGPWL